jgi:hypothetical protein
MNASLRSTVAMLVLCGPVTALGAAVQYGFDGTTLAPTGTVANVSASDMSIAGVVGYGCSITGKPVYSCGPTGGGTASFTVSPSAGYVLNVSRFSFDERAMADTDLTGFSVFTSFDSFAAPILSGSLSEEGAAAFTHHTTALALSGLSGPFTVRIVGSGWDGTYAVADWYLDNVTLEVEAVPAPVPLPAAAWLLLSGLGGLGWLGRRRKTS